MHSQRQFTPGKKSNMKRMIQYASNRNSNNECFCVSDKYDKTTINDSTRANMSSQMKISQAVSTSRGGKIQFGNFYLGEPLQLNYLGRMAGMPGGSGSPPTN
jgi:hypothetical protein